MERFEETTLRSVPTEQTAEVTTNMTLRALAEAATPGPWTFGFDDLEDGVFAPAEELGNIVCLKPDARARRSCEAWSDNAAYIAAAHPQAILELLDGVEDVADGLRALSCEIHGHKTLGGLSSAMMSMALKLEALSQPPREP